jgi:hypothetical protein
LVSVGHVLAIILAALLNPFLVQATYILKDTSILKAKYILKAHKSIFGDKFNRH